MLIREHFTATRRATGWQRAEAIADRLVGVISPRWANDRQEYRRAMAVAGALTSENSNLTAAMSAERHPDNDLIPDSPAQRRRCTLAYLNNALVKGVVDSEVRQVLGTLEIQAHSPDEKLNQLLNAEWKRALERGLHETLEMALRHILIDGGMVPHMLGKPTDPLRFEVIPYRRIKTPYGVINEGPTPPGQPRRGETKPMPSPWIVRDGFKFQSQGIGLSNDDLISCYVTNEESSYDTVFWDGEYTEIEVAAHPALGRLSGQTKALSWYSAAIARLEMVNRWMTALLASAELHATIVGIVMTPNKDARGLAATNTTLDATLTKNLSKYAREHRFLFLPGNADMKVIQANAPIIGEFLIWNLRLIARALGVSYERLTYDLTHTSFSSTKFGDRDDLITVNKHKRIVLQQLLKPLHRNLVASIYLRPGNGLTSGAKFAADVDAFCSFHANFPGRPPVDELKTEEANQLGIQNRTACRTDIAAESGKDAIRIQAKLNEEDANFLKSRTAMWKSVGYDEATARDLARDELVSLSAKAGTAPAPTTGAAGSAQKQNAGSKNKDDEE